MSVLALGHIRAGVCGSEAKPPPPSPPQIELLAREVDGVDLLARLDECLERDDRGRPRLTVTLPDETALANLARSLAALLA
jgi:hypothetical protein